MLNRPLPLVILIGALTTGCSESDPEYLMLAAPLPPMLSSPVLPADVAGTWYSRTEKNAVNCNAGETVDAQAIVIAQDGTDITMLTSAGDTYVGTVNGDIVEWGGNYAERGGESSFTSATLVFSANTSAGNAAWTWSNGTDSCNGTMAISAEKDAATPESASNSRPAIADPINFVDNVAFFRGSLGSGNTLGTGRDKYDYYSFTLAADAVLQAELSHFDTLAVNMDLLLFDENLDQVTISNSPGGFELIEAQIRAGTTYYIKVETRTISSEETYNLSIDIN